MTKKREPYKTFQQQVGEDVPTTTEIIHRPALERLASEFYNVRERRRQAEKDEGELKADVVGVMDQAGIKMYDGKDLEVRLVGTVKQSVDIRKAVALVSLKKMYDEGLLSVSKTGFEKYLKQAGVNAEPSTYLNGGKPSTRLDVVLKS